MATLEQQQFVWLTEILNEAPETFADYFKADIANYLDIETSTPSDLPRLFNREFKQFQLCTTKDDVRQFVANITGFIVMRSETDEIIASYFN